MNKPKRFLLAAATIASSLALVSSAVAADPELTLEWKPCGTAGAECATAKVPKDYDEPKQGTLEIDVAKIPATNPERRIGSLFFNFGGPGARGAIYVQALGARLFPVLNERFDIIGVDPRGTDARTGIDCKINQETFGIYAKPFFTPEAISVDRLLRRAEVYNSRCITRNRDLPYLSTANTARDFNAIRAAVGDTKMNYLGFSYGTFLGATIQSLFPGQTRAVALDGALDPDQYINAPMENLEEQSAGFERAISRFLITCAAEKAVLCPFGAGDPRGKLDELIERAEQTPFPAANAPDRPVTADDIRAGVSQQVYSIYNWQRLRDALLALERNDGAPMRALADGFWGRNPDGTFDSGGDKYAVLTSLEQSHPTQLSFYLQAGKRAHRSYDYSYWNAGYQELTRGLFPINARDIFTGPFKTGRKDPTTLVVGTRYDPATTYKQSQRLAKQLGNARFLTFNGDGHTAYDGDPSDGYNSKCADEAIEGYLFDLTLPAPGTRCKQDARGFVTPPGADAKTLVEQTSTRVIAPGTRPLPDMPEVR